MAAESSCEKATRSRRHRTQQWPLLSAVGLIIVLGVGAWVAITVGSRPPSRPSVQLPNGTTLTLLGVTQGVEEQVTGTPLQVFMHRLLPQSMKHASGATILGGVRPNAATFLGGLDPNAITFHTRTYPEVPSGAAKVTLAVVPFDEHGTGTNLGYSWSSNSRTWHYSTFPRRGKIVGLRFYRRKRGLWERVGELQAPNPIPGPHLTWNAPPVPLTQQVEDLSVTLTELTAGIKPKTQMFSVDPGQHHWRAAFRIMRNGKPTRDWSISQMRFTDATGNTWTNWSNGSTAYEDVGDEQHHIFLAGLWPDEQAYKLRCELIRNPWASVAPDELWTATDIPIPAPGKNIVVGKQGEVQGLTLAVERVAGAKTKLGGELADDGIYETPVAILRMPAFASEEFRWSLIRAVDDRGREFPADVRSSDSDPERTLEVLALEPPSGARSFSLHFAVHRTRFVEFLAPKRMASPAKP